MPKIIEEIIGFNFCLGSLLYDKYQSSYQQKPKEHKNAHVRHS